MTEYKTIFFPGWAMPPDKKLYEPFMPEYLLPFETADYGFFNPAKHFDFSSPDSEIAKFAEHQYDFIAGYSLGSQFALRLARLLPKPPKALIILSGFAKFAESKDNPFGQKIPLLNAMIAGMKIQPSKVLREFYNLCFGSMKQTIIAEKLTPVPSAMTEALRFLMNCDFREGASKINCPCLIIAGGKDTVVRDSLSEELAKLIKDSVFITETESNHSLPFTKQEKLKSIIDEFITKKNII